MGHKKRCKDCGAMKFHIGDKVVLKGEHWTGIHTVVGLSIGMDGTHKHIKTDLNRKYWLKEDCFDFYKDSLQDLLNKAKEIRRLGNKLLKI